MLSVFVVLVFVVGEMLNMDMFGMKMLLDGVVELNVVLIDVEVKKVDVVSGKIMLKYGVL